MIVSAHHDHEGADGTQIFNGADDNASGSVAVIDIAEAYVLAAKAGQRPRRSILFAVLRIGRARAAARIVGLHRAPAPAARQDGRGPEHGHDRAQQEVPVGGGRRFNGLEVQTRRVEQQQRQHHRHLRSPGAGDRGRAGEQGRCGLDLKMTLGQQRVESAPAQRSVAVPAARRAGDLVPQRAAPRLPHGQRPARKDQLREDGKDREARAPNELGPGPAARQGHGAQQPPVALTQSSRGSSPNEGPAF